MIQTQKQQIKKKMTNIGKLITFPELFNDEEDVVIPKVQRDYAYGRKESRVINILTGLLSNILNAVMQQNDEIILDFIYGGAYVKEDDMTAGMIPLDGQQRLTTLFLLYFYASLLEKNKVFDEDVAFLTHFKYETRQSANEFCHHLITDIRQNLINKKYDAEKDSIKKWIVDDAHYLMIYGNDPTVESMLNVLETIESMCRKKNMLHLKPCLWERLIGWNNIKFYTLSLNDFGLTDDLYIKMNSRGKRLTSFEIFKADIVAAIKEIDYIKQDDSTNFKDEFPKKMDAQWIDIAWEFTDKHIDNIHRTNDVTSDVDQRYFWLFKNIFWLEYCLKGSNTKDYKNIEDVKSYNPNYIKEILSDKDSVIQIMDVFDTLYRLLNKPGFEKIWEKYFYDSSVIIGEANKIRIFGRIRNGNIFEAAMQESFTVSNTVYFYALYLLENSGYDDSVKFKIMRIVRNLMATNVRLEDARTDKLPGFLKEIKYIVDHQGVNCMIKKDKTFILEGKYHKLAFVQNSWNEEYLKDNCLLPETYNKILKYENHDLLRASITLFMDYCRINSEQRQTSYQFDETHLLNLLDKFEKIFSNNYPNYLNKLRANFINQDDECYLQWDANMEGNSDGTNKRRYFITATWLRNYRQFFIRYTNRRNQESMLKIIEELPLPIDMKEPTEKCKEFSNENWKYYLAKYPDASNYPDARYGIGVWEDRDKRPLELIILNSSQHSSYNLEWMMMNLTLFNQLSNSQAYKLDPHGCSPIIIVANNSSLDFVQGGWNLYTYQNLPSMIATMDMVTCKKVDEKENTYYHVSFNSLEHEMDYIELGIELVNILSKAPEIEIKE